MKTNKEMLSSLLKTTQMGQIGIRCVRKAAVNTELKQALDAQLREYDAIETEAHNIAAQRGWRLPELNPAVRPMAEMMVRTQLMGGNRDSRIVGMMVLGNTQGVIKGLKNAHQHRQQDAKVSALSQKLLETEKANISQMEPFL